MEPPTHQAPRPGTERAYRPYTTKFDKEVRAKDIDTVLGPLGFLGRPKLDQAWDTLQTGLLLWKTQLHVKAAEIGARIRATLSEDERADTAVSLLIDQSGSMRGQKMLFAAATADVVQEFLSTLHFTCEVLRLHNIAMEGRSFPSPVALAFQAPASWPAERRAAYHLQERR